MRIGCVSTVEAPLIVAKGDSPSLQSSEDYGEKFSRKFRLSHPSEFKAVFQSNRKISSRDFSLRFKKNTLGYARLGVVVAKRNVRRANARNLIKRVVRESFRMHPVKLKNFDMVVVIYPNYGTLSRQEMRRVMGLKWEAIV